MKPEDQETEEDVVEDGFGTAAPAVCPMCGCRAVYVCRPGDIRCGVCYDNNTKEYYTGKQCSCCGMLAVHDGKCLACGPEDQETEGDIAAEDLRVGS